MDTRSPYRGLFMVNADVEECDMDLETRTCKNADYVAEVSGELPCDFVKEYDGGLPVSPFMKTTDYLDSVENRISRLKYFTSNMEEWKKKKSTAFQLLDDGSIEYISTALNNKMGEYSYECDHYLKSIHCLQEVVLEETKDIFLDPDQDEYVRKIIREMSQVDGEILHQFAGQLGGVQGLILLYKKTIEVFSEFMSIYANLLPAQTYMNFKTQEGANKCIATCSFTDIKTFYQDAYEALLSMMYIPVCLDNIVLRGDFRVFDSAYNDVFCPNNRNRDLGWYKRLDNGTRINKLNDGESYQRLIDFPANRLLRNGIGHNNIKYDSITQIITAYDLKCPDRINYQDSLMSVAIDCIGLAKSAVVFSEMILFMLRREFKNEGIRSIIHPRFYKAVQPNDKCPCGSGIKYKKCCQRDIEMVSRNK
ncbi:MAG: SEC-C domain-containing protein [Lachnospiraceae bacterium]|nr:SEC-C domain-containing protein [Lachnospiraceae bacterium]